MPVIPSVILTRLAVTRLRGLPFLIAGLLAVGVGLLVGFTAATGIGFVVPGLRPPFISSMAVGAMMGFAGWWILPSGEERVE